MVGTRVNRARRIIGDACASILIRRGFLMLVRLRLVSDATKRIDITHLHVRAVASAIALGMATAGGLMLVVIAFVASLFSCLFCKGQPLLLGEIMTHFGQSDLAS